MRCTAFCPSMLHVLSKLYFWKRRKHSAVYSFLILKGVTAQFSDMNPSHASIMQFADLSFALLQELWDGKVPRNDVACHAVHRSLLQNSANTEQFAHIEILTPHDQNIAHRCFYTEGCLYTGMLLYTGAFTQRCFSQRHAFTQRCFSQRHAFTHKRLRIQMLLRGDAFTRSYLYALVLYTGTLL